MHISPKKSYETVAQLKEELGVEVCSLYIALDAEQKLQMAASCGLNKNAVGSFLRYDQGLTGKVARTHKPLAVKNPQSHPDYFHIEGSGEEKYQSYLGIPLLHEEKLFGVLVVQTERTKMFLHSEIKSLYSAGRELMDTLLLSPSSAA